MYPELDAFYDHVDAHPDQDFEFVEGDIVEIPSVTIAEAAACNAILSQLAPMVYASELGSVFNNTVGYTLNPLTQLTPLVSYVPKTPHHDTSEYGQVVPDFVIESTRRPDQPARIAQKVRLYLEHETRLVWVIDVDAKTVTAYTLGTDGNLSATEHGSDAILSAAPVLPDLTIPVAELFPSNS